MKLTTSCPANLSKFVFHIHVCQFHAWALGPSISRPSFSAFPLLHEYTFMNILKAGFEPVQ